MNSNRVVPLLLAAFCLGAMVTLWVIDSPGPRELVTASRGPLVWSDEFDGTELDAASWNIINSISGGGNDEFQEYTASAVSVRDGNLVITPNLSRRPQAEIYNSTLDLEGCTDTWEGACTRTGTPTKPLPGVTSGKLTTQGKFAFAYGVLEARVKFPEGDWLWPAFWLLPNSTEYGWWPRSGELDVFEGRGNGPEWEMFGGDPNRRRLADEDDPDTWVYEPYGRNAFTSTVHCSGPQFKDDFDMVKMVRPVGSLADDDGFVVHGVRWSPRGIRTYYKDASGREHIVVEWRGHDRRDQCAAQYGNAAPIAPYDVPFYLIFNVAVGGDCGGRDYYWGHDTPWSPQNCPGKDEGLSSNACFLDAQEDWYKTWGENREMLVDWVRVWELPAR